MRACSAHAFPFDAAPQTEELYCMTPDANFLALDCISNEGRISRLKQVTIAIELLLPPLEL